MIGSSRIRLVALAACAAGVGVLGSAVGVAGADRPGWKGAESFAPTRIGPNTDRCGAFPRMLEAHFVGTGIDDNGGPFSVTASGCLDTEANVLFHLEATDTYLGSGDSVRIAPADTHLRVDPDTCVATNLEPVPFDVAGGTGRYTGTTGGGTYHIAFTLPTCPGPQQQVYVWFRGHIDTAA